VPPQPSTQPVGTDEIQDQPSAPSTPLPQPDSQIPQQPSTQTASSDENQTHPPIEIKSIPPDQQQTEADSKAQPSEFTQTTTDQFD